MVRKSYLAVLAIVTILAMGGAYGEDSGNRARKTEKVAFQSEKAVTATVAFTTDINGHFKEFSAAMETARAAAAQKGDVKEVARIESAVAGKPVKEEFSSYAARMAQKGFTRKVATRLRDYMKELDAAMKSALVDGNTADATNMKSVYDLLDRQQGLTDEISDMKKTTVQANEDWQATGIMLKQGMTVKFEASGTWSPGAQKRTGVDKWEAITGDADTYNFQASINDKPAGNGGKEWSFVAAQDGELRLRMVPYRNQARRGNAEGSLSVKVSMERSAEVGDLYHAILGILPPMASSPSAAVAQAQGAKTTTAPATPPASPTTSTTAPASATVPAAEGSDTTAKIQANQDWQSTSIAVKRGQLIQVSVDGQWSMGERATGKFANQGPVFDTADQFNIQVRVGDNGRVYPGGRQWSFLAQADGKLQFRMAPRNANQWKGTPSGFVTVTVTAESIR